MPSSISKNPLTRIKLAHKRKARQVALLGSKASHKHDQRKLRAGGNSKKQTKATMSRMAAYRKSGKK